ncbi:Aste57867_14191 [Aphanomyces stellatus]|uniref:Aste57867_14191 protein n=1 Tax=Aphanomyces stellatus TaxID=120398 RepID=A0A485L0X3_9STRA|nr:hypothetical protein As57867_014140 [Aphanomyces stellatus]VFT91016.1 Aste57867_14191 [Aphanomyces stellatus]
MMDPMAFLDIERRTGTSNQDLEEFIRKSDAVARAVEQIKNGTFDPENCDIPGYKTPEQEEAEEAERKKREAERKKREEERKQKEKLEEKELWWKRANLRFAVFDDEEDDGSKNMEAETWANRVVEAYKSRDANDYSMWSKWVPKDPVTLEEQTQQDALLEKMRNEEFEKSNPDFCTQFKEDLEKRQKSTREKAQQAEKNKRRGNTYYKKKQYPAAVTAYMEALDDAPYCPFILTNIAQAYMRQDNALDDALEFCNRALFVSPKHVKALSRKAAILHLKKDFARAFATVEAAVNADETQNSDLMAQYVHLKVDFEDEQGRASLDSQLSKEHSLDTWHLHTMTSLLEKLPSSDDSTGNQTAAQTTDVLRLLKPLLEADTDCRLLFRTSGALQRTCQRIVSDGIDEDETKQILACLVAMNDAGTHHRLFLDAPLRQWMTNVVDDDDTVHPASVVDGVLALLDACMDVKLWKTFVASSMPILRGLLRRLEGTTARSMVANVLFHASEVESCRTVLTTAMIRPTLGGILAALAHRQKNSLLPLLGLVLNLTNIQVFRDVVATEDTIPTQMTHALVALLKVRDATVVERAMAVLLNLSLESTSRIRLEMHAAGVHPLVRKWLVRASSSGEPDQALLARLVGILCRLHTLGAAAHDLAASETLEVLWRVFEVTRGASPLHWHLQAQLFCHVAWCLEVPTTREFLEGREGVCATLRFLRGRRATLAASEIAAFERTVTNCTKLWIGLLPNGATADVIVEEEGLELLVDLMSHMKDEKSARKNVAILLAKLCQRSDAIKERVRALRGIEMMLSICRDLKMT